MFPFLIIAGLLAFALIESQSNATTNPQGKPPQPFPQPGTPSTSSNCDTLRGLHGGDIGDIADPTERALVCNAYLYSTDATILNTLANTLQSQGYLPAATRLRDKVKSLSGGGTPAPGPIGIPLPTFPTGPYGFVPGPGHAGGPIVSPAPGLSLYTLTDADASTNPAVFAANHGFSSIEDFALNNPGLTLVPASGWPPVDSEFQYRENGVNAFGESYSDLWYVTPTGRLDPVSKQPTYYLGSTHGNPQTSVEYIFPSWNSHLTGLDGIPVGPSPVMVTTGSVSTVFQQASTINPAVVNTMALIPWIAGIPVQVYR
jgi:hypothetical protein